MTDADKDLIEGDETDLETDLEGGEGAEELAEGGAVEGEEGSEELNAEGEVVDDHEREEIRARRREERKQKREAQRQREESMRRELASRDVMIHELNTRLNAVEQRNQGSEAARVDGAITQAAQEYNYWKSKIAEGSQTLDGNLVAEATEKMFVAQRKYEDLGRIKTAYQQRTAQPAPLDPRLANHAKAWMEDNKWYDPDKKDMDSRIAFELDVALAAEGWNPTTPQYWEELQARVSKYLPHRVKKNYTSSNSRAKSTTTGSGRESAPSSGSGVYKLSPVRVQAIKDAGMWNDADKRKQMIKSYQDFDRANG
jgi:hypothetical protein